MKKILFSIIALAMFTTVATASEWDIDPDHSNTYFSVKHMMIADVHGMFPNVEGKVTIDDADITKSKVDVVIGVNSLDTGVEARDKHLRTPDFFDLENFPVMKFTSTKVIQKPDGGLTVEGKLTIRGNTRPVTLDVAELSEVITDPWGNKRRGIKATTKLNRYDFGVSWSGKLPNGADLVGSEINITIDAEVIEHK